MIKYGNQISVAMISMNEEGSIEKIINEIRDIDSRIEIILIDSSTDKTFEIAEKNKVGVIKQYPPKGYGLAMDLALRSCTKEIIITLDCDCTYPTKEIEKLSRLVIDHGYDIVDCNRLNGQPKNMKIVNYFGNKVFSFLASILFFKIIPDLHSGMRAYRSSVLKKIKYECNGPALPVELLLSFYKRKLKIKTINIDYFERVGKSKMLPLETSIWTLKRIFKVKVQQIKNLTK
jgi:glycosyltransferase involved in cell wall biosynthesis